MGTVTQTLLLEVITFDLLSRAGKVCLVPSVLIYTCIQVKALCQVATHRIIYFCLNAYVLLALCFGDDTCSNSAM